MASAAGMRLLLGEAEAGMVEAAGWVGRRTPSWCSQGAVSVVGRIWDLLAVVPEWYEVVPEWLETGLVGAA